jgi:uncharacterized protein (DUF2147 family)
MRQTFPDRLRLALLALCACVAVAVTAAPQATPSGRWKVVSDVTNKPVAIMKVFEQDGEYRAMIEKILDKAPDEAPSLCERCPGALKGQPIEGLVIMHGLKARGEGYGGGRILDPDSGNYYRVKMSLGTDGETLRVRGYLGVSLLGRTQTWYRVE